MTVVRSISVLALGALLLAVTSVPASTAAPSAVRLSAAQTAVIAREIAKLKSPQERSLASGWTDAKKVAEFICRPLATTVLKRRSNADRVFLGTDDSSTLQLRSGAQLTGNGQYRSSNNWQNFTFSCALNPRNGTAASFQTIPAPAG